MADLGRAHLLGREFPTLKASQLKPEIHDKAFVESLLGSPLKTTSSDDGRTCPDRWYYGYESWEPHGPWQMARVGRHTLGRAYRNYIKRAANRRRVVEAGREVAHALEVGLEGGDSGRAGRGTDRSHGQPSRAR